MITHLDRDWTAGQDEESQRQRGRLASDVETELTAVCKEREEPSERDGCDLDAERGQVGFEPWQFLPNEVLKHALVRPRACAKRRVGKS